MNVVTLNKIAPCGMNLFDPGKFTAVDDIAQAEIVLLRSYSMLDMDIPASVKAIARAGAGTNNIPIDKCTEQGVVVFNTPGANANGVKELAICGMFLAARDIVGGIGWVKTLEGDDVAKQVEKGKGNFAGGEIEGKKLLVLGLGAIGAMVANTAYQLGMDVLGFDPFITVKSALSLSRWIKVKTDLNEALAEADYISLHVPLTPDTKNMINAGTISAMKPGVKLLNFSRADLVNTGDLGKALEDGKISRYVTDFPNAEVLKLKNVIPIPHLGASTEESEDNCAIMAAEQAIDYMENGNITNSVNFPDCKNPRTSAYRVVILHKNVPNMLTKFSGFFSEHNINIETMINQSKKDNAVTIIDALTEPGKDICAMSEMDEVMSVRIIK